MVILRRWLLAIVVGSELRLYVGIETALLLQLRNRLRCDVQLTGWRRRRWNIARGRDGSMDLGLWQRSHAADLPVALGLLMWQWMLQLFFSCLRSWATLGAPCTCR